MLNQTSFSLDEATNKDAIDLVKQAMAKMAFPSNLPIAGRNRQNMGQASIGYVQDCIAAGKLFPKVPSGEIDVAVLEQKLKTAGFLDEFINNVVFLVNTALNLRRLVGQDLMSSSNGVKDSFESSAKNNAEHKATAAQLKKRYARAKKEDAAAEKQAKAAQITAGQTVVAATNGVHA